jgi:hypothetical protein
MLYNWPIAEEKNDLQPYALDASDIVSKQNLLEFGEKTFSKKGKRHCIV